MNRLARFGSATLAAAGISIGAAGLAPSLAAAAQHITLGAGQAVFVQNDNLEGNQIIAYSRSDEGTLTQVGEYATGGKGGQLEGSVVDHTASQGSLSYDRPDNLLLAVNAGSNTLSVFSANGDSLRLLQVLSSGGEFPVSVTASNGYVYVLNAEHGGSIQGFVVYHDRLYPNPGANRALHLPVAAPGSGEQFTHTPGQIAFTPNGSKLIVTTKAAGQSIEVFNAHTLAPEAVVNAEPGAVPFAVSFDSEADLLVAEAGPSALASFDLNPNGTVTQLDAVATGQAATCWVAGAAGYFYASNAGSASVSGFHSGPHGVLSDLGNTTTHPGTVDAASVGSFLYVQGGGEGTVDEFEVQSNGSLKSLGSVLVPHAVGGEGIVAS
jgi:DNA-binding beta-propeller fold protein YncE